MASTATDVSQSSGYTTESASDESWSKISPLSRGKKRDQAQSVATPRSKDAPRHQHQSSISAASGSQRRGPDMQYRAGMSQSTSTRTPSTMTPTKGSASTSTPESRAAAIMNYMSSSRSPTKPPKSTPRPMKVIVIEDSTSDEDNTTDIDDSDFPTRPPHSLNLRPLPNDSSQSSLESTATYFPVSATSSFSSVGSSSIMMSESSTAVSKSANSNGPVEIHDMFSAMNITTRRNQTVASSHSAGTASARSTPTRNNGSRAISQFAGSSFGVDLEEFIIAHNDKVQRFMDDNGIPWGTQYEVARGVSNGSWTWDTVQQKLSKLPITKEKGSSVGLNATSAYKVRQIMQGKDAELLQTSDLSIWKELDREQAAIEEGLSRGLGLMGEWHGAQDWYGGRIQQIIRLVKEDSSFKMLIEPLEMKKSNRFARFYGSRRFLHLRISEELLKSDNDAVKAFLLKKFVLCGRTFVPFHSKDEALYLVETDEDYHRIPRDYFRDNQRMSFQEFINWHNPLDVPKNNKQVISKYAARFALGLSNSVPILEFKEENIFFIRDITAEDWPADKPNPPADKLMTDGCGLINHCALLQIVKGLGYENLPAGVQGRIDGSKGFWILHPTDDSPEPKIWIRDSQNKIKNRTFDRAHRIFDLLAPSRPSASIALTAQSIINLFNNGMPREMLARLMEEGLEQEVAPLLDWTSPHAMIFLWDAINKAGNVSGSRTQRLATSLSRALGLKGRDWGREDDGDAEEQDRDDGAASGVYTGRSGYSSAPLSLNEFALEMIQAGFHPASNYLLHEKLFYIVQNTIKSSVEKYRIPIEESFGAYVVPDPLGILEEGEIFYKFSRPRKDPNTEMLVHTLEGDVVLGRYPIRLPSDMQKVRAVDRRELDKWTDVVVVSVKGKRSIASLLADGDLDGDELIVIFNQEIVSTFHSQPFTNPPPNFIQENFEASSKVETVEEFCVRATMLDRRQTSEEFLKHLISNLNQSQVGLYSMMHEVSCITQGYDHDESIRLAYIFATLLDASKTGHRLKQDVFRRDKLRYPKSSIAQGDPTSASRNILQYLTDAAKIKGQQLVERFHEEDLKFFSENKRLRYENKAYDSYDVVMKQFKEDTDPDLTRPYHKANKFATQVRQRTGAAALEEEMSRIRRHVWACKVIYDGLCKSKKEERSQESPTKGAKKAKKLSREEPMAECAAAYAKPVRDVYLTPNIDEVKAAVAYMEHPGFAYTVAFGELCRIKAAACSGGLAPSLRIFDEAKSMSAPFLRALKRCHEEGPAM
ncbi:hypothetical protein D9613_004267 [Agrocybe pediades]|uniref:RNA-dependent RNA polymerase n=1 Tax=Agrocybe pediades TaxID=84607 RepID=A0A8H4QIH3_9AGAR|nr:hypothetical protein D9613_004267 [Agrocybe pediades]